MKLREEISKWYGLKETKAEVGRHADQAPEGQHMIYSVTKWKQGAVAIERDVEILYVSMDQIKAVAGASVQPAIFDGADKDRLVIMVLVPEASFGIFLWRFRKGHDQKFFESEFYEWCKCLMPLLKKEKHLLITITDWEKRKYDTEEVELSKLTDYVRVEDFKGEDIAVGVNVPERNYSKGFRFAKE